MSDDKKCPCCGTTIECLPTPLPELTYPGDEPGYFELTINQLGMIYEALDGSIKAMEHIRDNTDKFVKIVWGEHLDTTLSRFEQLRYKLRVQSLQWSPFAEERRSQEEVSDVANIPPVQTD